MDPHMFDDVPKMLAAAGVFIGLLAIGAGVLIGKFIL